MKNHKVKKTSKKSFDLHFPSLQKNRDNIALLIAYPEFQQEIKKVRLYIDIPEKGNSGNEEIREWSDEIVKKSDELLNSPNFIKQEQQIREKFKRKEINYWQANEQSKLLYGRVPLNYLNNSVGQIVKKFHLPGNYDKFVYNYITTNKITVPTSGFVIGGFGSPKDWKELGYIPIKIFMRLSDKDLKELKKETDDWIDGKLPKYQTLKNINKKLEIKEWHDNPARYDDANEEEYKMSNKEIAENLLGSKKKGNKVYEISRTIKKLWLSRFGKQ